LNDKADNGDLQTNGYYLFYHIFKFIGGMALFLAIVSFGILVYLVVNMIKGAPGEVS